MITLFRHGVSFALLRSLGGIVGVIGAMRISHPNVRSAAHTDRLACFPCNYSYLLGDLPLRT